MSNFFKIFLLAIFIFNVSICMASTTQVTVSVKKLEPDESGDGFTIKTKSGKDYYVYNKGGSSPRPGEKYLKKGVTVCLTLNPKDGTGDVDSVKEGACK